MSKFESFIVERITPVANRFAAQRHVSAMQRGFMSTITVILVSAVFMIVASPPVTQAMVDEGGFWALFGPWLSFATEYKTLLLTPFNMTMGLIALIAAVAIAYNLAESYRMNQLSAATNSAVIFLLVAAPSQMYQLADGTSITALNTGYLGAAGLFVAIIVALASVEITRFCLRYKLTIKLPDSVPQFLSDTFAAIIPLFANIVIFLGANILVGLISPGLNLPSAIAWVLAAPIGAVNSVPGAIVLCTLILVFWCVGIHGTLVTLPVVAPIVIQAFADNAAAYTAGDALTFYPIFMTLGVAFLGGTGNTLGFVLLCLRARSTQLRAFGKVGIIPSIFRISEPVIFGAPIMFNPLLMVPFVVGGVGVAVLYWLVCTVGLVTSPYLLVSGTFPIFLSIWIMCLDWRVIVFLLAMIPLLILLWYPFFRAYDSQLLRNEQEAEAHAQNTPTPGSVEEGTSNA